MDWFDENSDGKKVYLAGPIFRCTDEESKNWRSLAKELLELPFIDPMDRDYRGVENQLFRQIVNEDKAEILKCWWMLAYCPRPSFGTPMEVLFGYERGLHVVTVSETPCTSPWLKYHSQYVSRSVEEACDYINSRI